MYFRT